MNINNRYSSIRHYLKHSNQYLHNPDTYGIKNNKKLRNNFKASVTNIFFLIHQLKFQ